MDKSMNNSLLLAAALLLLTMNAQADKKTTAVCPVIPSQSVDIKEATAKHMYADYKGQRYYFCCVMCPEAFRKNPSKYIKGAQPSKSHTGKAQGHTAH